MIKFIQNIGDYFSSNYFDEDFAGKVLSKCGYGSDEIKEFNKKITPIKDRFFKYKQLFIEGKLRTKDKIKETHQFHTLLLNALGYEGDRTNYNQLFHLSESDAIPVRHILYRGDQPHLMIMEMQALIKEDDKEPDGLFEQRYNVEDELLSNAAQKYHRKQWEEVFQVPDGIKISPVIINKAISELFLLEPHIRPKYILLLAGNGLFLLEQEKWFRGSYLQFDLEELFSEAIANPRANYYSLFYFLTSKEALAPETNMVLLDQLDEDSHKSAYEVTKDLKEGIIHAVEALANEAIWYHYNVKAIQENLDETDDDFEQQVKDDCLRIIYRMLFVFYAESREDLDVLPSNDPIYNKGYSLEMLRDLEQVPLHSETSLNGYFFHESLSKLFHVLSAGYRERENGNNKSFKVRHIDSPIFDDRKLHHLQKVKFRNRVWQDIICRLSLSKQQRNRARGRISYANLGINQLGSVYESLLAYRGFYAEQDYIEVHKKPNFKDTDSIEQKNTKIRKVISEGTYLVPRSRRDDFEEGEILKDDRSGEDIILKKGTFVYRLSGRDRQKSASYYTPEVLTQSTVKYTLKPILERLERGEMKAIQILDLKLLEPAMGAAAFQNEMINQLSEAYLSYRQKELRDAGRVEWKVEPDKYKEELQRIKAYIATNNTYGVDLNPTAIELGKLSLWLNVIHKDMETPFFSNRICIGNAVVGAWLKVYKEKDIAQELDKFGKPLSKQSKKEWWETAPRLLEFKPQKEYTKIKHGRKADEIYHFLLPDKNMVPSTGIKMLKEEYSVHSKHVSNWKKEWTKPLNKTELERVKAISNKIDELLTEYYQFQLTIAVQTNSRQNIFGATRNNEQAQMQMRSYDEKERLNDQRNRHSAPYFKLKMVMDYWCSLWFWDMRKADQLPNRIQFWNDISSILELDTNAAVAGIIEQRVTHNLFESTIQLSMAMEPAPEKNKIESADTDFIDAVVEYTNRKDLFDNNQRLTIVSELSKKYFFFHPQLEFLEVFWERGGFDLIAGNPPWVVVNIDLAGFLSDTDPICVIRNYDSDQNETLLSEIISKQNITKQKYLEDLINVECSKTFSGATTNYSLISGQKPNLHKLVIENCLNLSSGLSGIIHDKGIYEDNNGQEIRKVLYKKLEYYFQFQNELKLFADVGNTKKFEISIFNKHKSEIQFAAISNLFHPSTIDQCFIPTNSLEILGIKNENNEWELRGNQSRVIKIDSKTLQIYSDLFEEGTNDENGTLANIHSTALNSVLLKFNFIENKLKKYENEIEPSMMLNETNSKRDGIIQRNPSFVSDDFFILAGPHFYVANPMFQTPNEGCSSHRDYSYIDLNQIDADYLPRTIYQLLTDGKLINTDPNYYYVNRKRAQPSNERTLMSCIQPPGRVHTIGSYSLHFKNELLMLSFSAYSFSIVYDFYVRITNREDILFDTISNLPLFESPNKYIIHRALLLNCITSKYANLWNKYSYLIPEKDSFSSQKKNLPNIDLDNIDKSWTFEMPLKDEYSRRQALLEIDVLVALELGLTWEEFITIYRIQFPVLASNESKLLFDKNGRSVPTTIKNIYQADIERVTIRAEYSGYLIPFDKCDRVEDYKIAWKHFEEVFKEK
jgi:hypothetical protein